MTVAGHTSEGLISGKKLLRRLRWLIFHTWNIPPVFGLGFILLIGVMQPTHMIGILTTPLEPLYNSGLARLLGLVLAASDAAAGRLARRQARM